MKLDDDDELTPTPYPVDAKPLSEVQKLKQERRKKAKEAMIIKAAKPDPVSDTMRKILDERKSFLDTHYPGSRERDWTKYKGVGWVHVTEQHEFEAKYLCCSITGTYFKNTYKPFRDGTLNIICPEEAEKNYDYCSASGYLYKKGTGVTVYKPDDTPMVVAQAVADGSFQKCDISGKLYHQNNMAAIVYSDKYKRVLGSHAIESKGFASCSCCSGYMEKDILISTPSLGNICPVCFNHKKHPGLIGPHNDKAYPAPMHKTITRLGHSIVDGQAKASMYNVEVSDKRLWGVELETEFSLEYCLKHKINRYDIAKDIKKTLGSSFVIIKEDGTLQMNGKYSNKESVGPLYAGIEIVSAPCDLATHRERWPLITTAEWFSALRSWDTESCGFHAHVSKEALTKLTQGRMLRFINHPDNAWFIWKVAGRSQRKFARYEERKISDVWHSEHITNPNEDNPHNRSRRVALNFANKNTIEFRIFRGTVNPRHIIRNLEFCEAICDFCYPSSRSLRELNDARYFINFVSTNRKKWPLLAGWMVHWGMITAPAPNERAKNELFTLKKEVDEPEDKSNIPEQEEEIKPLKKLKTVLISAAPQLWTVGTTLHIISVPNEGNHELLTMKPPKPKKSDESESTF